jgi:MHS family proline/betaine transporter-like MFS transporter
MTNAAYYLTFTYAVERRKALTTTDASVFQLANTVALFVVLFAKPLGGWLSDRIGRRRLMMSLTVVMMALIYSAYRMMLYGAPKTFIVGQMILGVPLGMALGLQGAMIVEIFPLRTRVTSMSFAYSLTLALAGGTAPMVSNWLIETLKQPLAPVFYIIAYGVFGLAVMWPMAETNARRLDQ